MVIRSGSDFLEIAVRERLPAGNPLAGDFRATVAATGGAGFAGRYDEVWISRPEFEGFVEALRDLDRDRRGKAELTAMSPNDFTLVVFAVDRAGHLAAEGWVGREYTGRNGIVRHRVCFSLELDPSTFPALVGEFQALGAAG